MLNMTAKQYEDMIAARNAAWRKASKQRKRIWLARDVIAQINAEYFAVKPKQYVTQAYDIIGDKSDTSVQCAGCALGGLVVACKLATKEHDYGALGRPESVRGKLSDLFDNHQLNLIESAFELDYSVMPGLYCQGESYAEKRARMDSESWVVGYEPEARLKLIMANIINNKGTFNPSVPPTDHDFQVAGVTKLAG